MLICYVPQRLLWHAGPVHRCRAVLTPLMCDAAPVSMLRKCLTIGTGRHLSSLSILLLIYNWLKLSIIIFAGTLYTASNIGIASNIGSLDPDAGV